MTCDGQARKRTGPMAKIAMKFGGTSVADLDRIRHVATLVKKEVDRGNQVAVVVSAMAGETNKLVGYLGVVSRHLDAPLAVIVQSSSAAGKSSLMEAVLAFLPEEQRVQYSAMTGQ